MGRLNKGQQTFVENFVRKKPPAKTPPATASTTTTGSASTPFVAPPRKIAGCDFADDAAMKLLVEHYAEVATAQTKVIQAAPDPSAYQTEQNQLNSVVMKLATANEGRKSSYKSQDIAKIDASLTTMQAIIDDLGKIARKLREIYRNDVKASVKAEHSDDALFTTSDTMHAIMLDEFYEMAHVGALLAKEFNSKAKKAKKKKLPIDKMEMGEIAAIVGYSTNDYAKLNGRLRDPSSGDPETDGYIEATVKGLEKLPKYKGSVTRCDRSAQYFFDEIVATGNRTEKAFMSTGLKKVPGFGDVETYIKKVKTGKEITGFSIHEGEGEVLFPPGSVFKFVSYTAADGTKIKKASKLAASYPNGAAITDGVFEFKQVK